MKLIATLIAAGLLLAGCSSSSSRPQQTAARPQPAAASGYQPKFDIYNACLAGTPTERLGQQDIVYCQCFRTEIQDHVSSADQLQLGDSISASGAGWPVRNSALLRTSAGRQANAVCLPKVG